MKILLQSFYYTVLRISFAALRRLSCKLYKRKQDAAQPKTVCYNSLAVSLYMDSKRENKLAVVLLLAIHSIRNTE